MPKKDYGEVVGKCGICTINLWSVSDALPVVWPCNVKDCPYEHEKEQHSHLKTREHGYVGSGLGQMI
tara:strand:+ start:541 stop:741 length:201 start_codon:yes stop_codon:yes gene_type:complete